MNVIEESLQLLGTHQEDVVTGCKGMVDSICFDAYGCVQAILRPSMKKDGTLPDTRWFDVKRLRATDRTRIMDAPDFGIEYGDEKGPADKPLR